MSVIDDINKRRTRQNPGGNEPVAPSATVTPQTVQRRPSEDVASQPQVVQPQVQEPVNRPVGDQAAARVAQGAMPQVESGFNPTAEQKATAMALMNPAAPGYTIPQQAVAPAVEPVTTYTDIAKRINPELDAEAKAKREKQLRTKKQVAAIGDAISALANMHYTGTSGVNAYDPSATLSGKAKENYDKFLADAKSYEDAHKAAMLRGAELDAAATEARRKEAVADARYKELAAIAEKERIQKQKNWEKQFEAEQAYKAETLKLQKQVNADNKKIREEANRIREKYQDEKVIQKMTNDFYGKPYVFNSSDGKQVVIYDRVWRKSMPQIFEMLKAEKVGKGTMGDFMYNMQFDNMTPQEVENWVNANWHKSPAVVAEMEELAKNTPESFRATQTKSEDWSGWSDDNSIDEDFQ